MIPEEGRVVLPRPENDSIDDRADQIHPMGFVSAVASHAMETYQQTDSFMVPPILTKDAELLTYAKFFHELMKATDMIRF